MAYARITSEGWVELSADGFTAPTLITPEASEDNAGVEPYLDDVQYPANWIESASAEALAALGIAEIEEPEPAPSSARVIGTALEGVDQPRRVWLTEAIPVAELRADALVRLATRRWERQQTMLWNGNPVPSDDTTLGRIMATVKLAEIQGKAPADIVAHWKFAPGFLTPVTLAQAIDYGVSIGAHYQACFSWEAALAAIVIAPGASAEAILAAAEAP